MPSGHIVFNIFCNPVAVLVASDTVVEIPLLPSEIKIIGFREFGDSTFQR